MNAKPQVRLQRANFVVRNIERALTFYRDVLGFEETYRLGHNPESYSYPVFEIPRSAQIGFSVLSTAQQPRILALTQIEASALSAVPHPRRSAIVLEVADPDAVVAGARKLGLRVYPEEVLRTQDGRVGREIGIADFDDNLVVIYSIP
jgi:catechol 2,3-dioxygenase-like lactoylglutathione lyase family enzyme